MKALVASAVIAAVCVWAGFPLWLALIPIAFLLIKPVLIIVGCSILILFLLIVSAIYGNGSVGDTLSAMKDGVKEEIVAIYKGK